MTDSVHVPDGLAAIFRSHTLLHAAEGELVRYVRVRPPPPASRSCAIARRSWLPRPGDGSAWTRTPCGRAWSRLRRGGGRARRLEQKDAAAAWLALAG